MTMKYRLGEWIAEQEESDAEEELPGGSGFDASIAVCIWAILLAFMVQWRAR